MRYFHLTNDRFAETNREDFSYLAAFKEVTNHIEVFIYIIQFLYKLIWFVILILL